MAPGDGYQVDEAALAAHADGLDRLADAVGQARAAGATVRLGGSAYGLLCGWLPALFDPVQEACVDALLGVQSGLHEAAAQLRDTAGTYRATEDASSGMFGGPAR